jgi:5'-methylthioadenosine phosphorylase
VAHASHPSIDAGIVGGSGLYELLEDAERVVVESPYGAPSAPIAVGELGGRTVGFLPRHGAGHVLPPHAVNYRANLWALAELGASDVILPCAAGSLRKAVEPGQFVVCDQLVDRTKYRADTLYHGPVTTHIGLADPYDAEMRRTALASGQRLDLPVVDGGTVAVIEGPRFSTRAESKAMAAMGWDLVNMTQYPEVALARELQMAALGIAVVTDYDVGLDDDPTIEPVSKEAAMQAFEANIERLRRLLADIVASLPLSPDRPALTALTGAQFNA